MRDFAGAGESAAHSARPRRKIRPSITTRSMPSTSTAAGRSKPKAKRILHGLAFREADFDRAAKTLERRLGHARASRALARAWSRICSARRADQPSRSRIARLVSGISEELPRRDPDDLARSRIPEPARRLDHRDRARTAASLPRQLGQLRRTKSRARRAARSPPTRTSRRKSQSLQAFADRFRAKASKASQAQSKLKQIDRMEKIEAPVAHEKTVHFRFPQPPRSGHRVIKLEDVDHAYGDLVVYRGLNFEAERGQRTVLVGPNGAGKSTLLKLLGGVARRAERHARTRAQRQGRLLLAIPRRDAEADDDGARDRARHAEPGLGADRAHGARLVPLPRRRRFQDDRRAQRR